MDEFDLEVRNHLYARFVELGRVLRPAEAEAELDLAPSGVESAYRRLHDAHALVLERDTLEVRMLNPFSCIPSAYRVSAGGRTWYANCAWDSFGICAALQADGRIETSCPDCAEPVELEVRERNAVDGEYLFHVLVPARQWWDDIVFT